MSILKFKKPKSKHFLISILIQNWQSTTLHKIQLGPGYFLLRRSLRWNLKHLLRESPCQKLLFKYKGPTWIGQQNFVATVYCLQFPRKRCCKFHGKLFAVKFTVKLLTSLRGNPWHFCAKNWYDGTSKPHDYKIRILLQMCHRFLRKSYRKFHRHAVF